MSHRLKSFKTNVYISKSIQKPRSTIIYIDFQQQLIQVIGSIILYKIIKKLSNKPISTFQ